MSLPSCKLTNMKVPCKRIPELRLLIVDDHSVFREGLLAMFGKSESVNAVAIGPDEAVRRGRRFRADAAVIGVGAAHRRMFELARRLRAASHSTRLLFLDEGLRPVNLGAALSAGGLGYWTKHASFEELAAAVRRVAAGQWSFSPAAQRHLHLTPDGPKLRPVARHGPLASLSRRETEVLGLLAEGLRVKECAQRLHLAPSTVDNHKWRLMKKLSVHTLVDLARLAVREGLVAV